MSDANEQVGTRPLAKVVSDHEDLLADPASFLKKGELRIGARRVSFGWFLLVPVLFCVGIYLMPSRIGYALAFCSPVFLGILLYWAWPVPRELIMRLDGVEFLYRDSKVWCPWSLFSVEGQAFVQTA